MASKKRKASRTRPSGSATPIRASQAPKAGIENTASAPVAWNWSDAAILAPILLIGLILRILYLQEIITTPDFAFPMMDAAYKDAWAKSMLTGRWPIETGQPDPGLAENPYLRPPGYSIFLAVIYLLTGTSYLAVRLVQMAMGLASVVLIYALGRSLFGRAVGAVSAAFLSVYWIFIYFEGELMEPPLLVFLLLLLANMVRAWPAMPGPRHFAWPGACVGMLILLRPETIFLVPFILLWGWWVSRGHATPMVRTARLAVFGAVIAAFILPVTARNYFVSGEFVPICTIGGLNLYAGNNPNANGSFPRLDYRELFGVSTTLSHHNFQELLYAHQRNTGDPDLGHADLERFFVSEALGFMRENPGQTLRLAVRKVLLFWGPWEVTSNKVLYFDRLHSRVLAWLPGFPLVAGLAFAGFAMWVHHARQRAISLEARQAGLLMAAIVVVSCLTHILFFVVARFRVPVIPFLIIFAAYALVSIYLMARAKQWPRAGGWSAACVALIALFSVPLVPYEYEKDRWHYMRGMAYGVTGDIDTAVAELQAAIDAGGHEYWLLSEMGFAWSIQGEYDTAIEWFERALEREPHDAQTRNRYGYALLQSGRLEEAEQAFRTALANDFTQFEARLNLALMMMNSNRPEEAEAEYRQLLDIHPNHVGARFNLGLVLSNMGRSEEAQAVFREVLELAPAHAAAWNYLGLELAGEGRLEEAREAYLTALSHFPGYWLVHVNLGNLYTHLGKYDEATLHYIEVLTRDDEATGGRRPSDDFDALAQMGLGFMLAERGEREIAISRFRLSLEINPTNPTALNALGYELMQRGDLDEARELFERAIEHDPGMLLARNNLGDLLVRIGRPREARAHYQAALEIQPGNEYARNALARMEGRLRGREEIQDGETNILLF